METLKQNALTNASALALIILGGAAFLIKMPDLYYGGLIMAGLALFRGVKVISP